MFIAQNCVKAARKYSPTIKIIYLVTTFFYIVNFALIKIVRGPEIDCNNFVPSIKYFKGKIINIF